MAGPPLTNALAGVTQFLATLQPTDRVQLLPFSNEIMAACYKTSGEVYDEIATKNAKFRKVYEPWKKFRDEQVQWFSIAENRYDNFMVAAQRSSQRVTTKK